MSGDRATADIGLTGLAVMGSNLARNIARHGHVVAVHNRTTAKMTTFLDEHGDDAADADGGFVGSESMADFGAHTYQRVDKDGTFHTRWADDCTEVEA